MRGGDEDTAVSRPIARASPSPLGAQRSPAGGAHISTGRLRSTQSLAHLGQNQITATGMGLAVAQLQWHGAAGSPRSSGCLSGSSGGNRAAFGLIITLSVLSCTRGDIPGPANTLWNLGVVLGAIPSAKTKRVLSLKAISTLNLIALGARRPQQSSLQMPFVPAPLPTQAASSQAPVLGENLSLLSKSDQEINTELSLLRRKKKSAISLRFFWINGAQPRAGWQLPCSSSRGQELSRPPQRSSRISHLQPSITRSIKLKAEEIIENQAAQTRLSHGTFCSSLLHSPTDGQAQAGT